MIFYHKFSLTLIKKAGFFLLLVFFVSCRSIHFYTSDPYSFTKEKRLAYLSDALHETSGLEVYRDSFISFNDSGGNPELFILPMSKPWESGRKLWVRGINTDYEDITRDAEFLYLGDFGDNTGLRDTLVIYKIPIESLGNDTVSTEKIKFMYYEKQNTPYRCGGNAFDCEAMALINDSLYLFTKNRIDKSSSVYKLPAHSGFYEVKSQNILFPKMLVTAADYNPQTRILYLMGYDFFIPVFRTYKFQDDVFQEIIRIKFWNHPGLQTEGIVNKEDKVYFSNERSIARPGIFYLKEIRN